MGKAAYPNVHEIRSFLLTHPAITLESLEGVDLATHALDAKEAFEKGCGRRFLIGTQTRTFTFPRDGSRALNLGADLVSLTSLTVGGITKTLNTDFELKPENASSDGKPYEWVKFVQSYAFSPQSIRNVVITGVWGYGTTIPETVWNGILRKAAVLAATAPENALNEGVLEVAELDTREKYAASPLGELTAQWEGVFQSAVKRYKKVVGVGT